VRPVPSTPTRCTVDAVPPPSGVAHDRSEAKITVVGVPDKPGKAAAIFEAVAAAEINLDMIVQNVSAAATGLTDVSFTLPKTAGQRAMDAVESGRQSAASTLDDAASGIRSKADALPGGPEVGRFARRAADRIGGAAQYLREHEVKDMMSEVESFIKEHPAQALLGAAVVGFLAGRSMRS